MDERNYIPFFRNYLDAALALPYKQGCELVFALCYTGLTGKEPEHKLTGAAAAVYAVVKPNLLTSFERAKSGSKGGSKSQANYQANYQANAEANTEANGQANGEQTAKHKEKEKDKYIYTSNNTSFASKSGGAKKKDFAAQYVKHGEISPLMEEAAKRMLNEEENDV